MKKDFDGEKLAVVIVSIIILFIIGYAIYSIFSSNRSFYSNESAKAQEEYNSEQKTEDNDKTNEDANINTDTEANTDKMNVDTDKAKEVTKPKEPVETEIANFTSTLYDKDENRVYNIGLAIGKLNNVIVKKGEEFSFNNTIGPMGLEQGYKEAVGFDTNGKKIKVPGGGMCQISSTLYNSVLMANLEVTERHPHSRRVYYVPKDKDATIYYPSLDLKFKNNTDSDIKIVASNNNINVTIKLIKIT